MCVGPELRMVRDVRDRHDIQHEPGPRASMTWWQWKVARTTRETWHRHSRRQHSTSHSAGVEPTVGG
eukprot:1601162-Rhodomonas_salina.4